MTNTKPIYYKHPQFKHVYGEEIRTPLVRFAWPSLVTPKDPPPPKDGQQPGQPRYEITGLLKNDAPETVEFLKKLKKMTDEMLVVFNEGRPAPIALKSFIADGDDFDAEKYPYYQDHYVLVARNQKPIEILGRMREEITPDKILGGMQGLMLITPLITSHGVSYKLSAVQLVTDDGTRFGGFNRDVKSKFVDWDTPAESAPVVEEAQAPVAPEVVAPVPVKNGKKKALDML